MPYIWLIMLSLVVFQTSAIACHENIENLEAKLVVRAEDILVTDQGLFARLGNRIYSVSNLEYHIDGSYYSCDAHLDFHDTIDTYISCVSCGTVYSYLEHTRCPICRTKN